MRRLCLSALALCLATTVVRAQTPAQTVTSEYELKAAFLYNFVRLVEWPAGASNGSMRICIAGPHPIQEQLEETVRGETVEGQPLAVRSILQPDSACDVLFIPRRFAAAHEYLRAVEGKPVLTVGESPEFIQEGGIVNFFLDGKRVRFEINPTAAMRANLRISSRLLQLARLVGPT
jgi:hypothetical protein